jgi:TBC1 domain family protein 5
MFQTTFIKEMMTTILFIWSKENSDVSYRQGMNEILAVILLAIFPFYHKDKTTYSNSNTLKDKINLLTTEGKNESLANELYSFLYNEIDLQADLYTLFNSIMQRGVLELYRTTTEDSSKKEVFAGVESI